jgi:hypothetical protein
MGGQASFPASVQFIQCTAYTQSDIWHQFREEKKDCFHIVHRRSPYSTSTSWQLYSLKENLPEPIVMKQFHPKEGAWEGAEPQLTHLATFAQVINIFLLPLFCFSHREHTKPPVFREGTLFPSFVYTKVPSLLNSFSSYQIGHGLNIFFDNYDPVGFFPNPFLCCVHVTLVCLWIELKVVFVLNPRLLCSHAISYTVWLLHSPTTWQ